MSAVRRRTDPYMTQRIWDSITFLIRQRNPPTNDGVTRHLSRIHCMTESEAQEELDKAVEDGLVVRKKSPTKKIASFESVELALPTELSPDEDSHDWYCCECQKAGQVQCCKQCYRVFHPDCHKPSDPESNVCSFCEVCKTIFLTFYLLCLIFNMNKLFQALISKKMIDFHFFIQLISFFLFKKFVHLVFLVLIDFL